MKTTHNNTAAGRRRTHSLTQPVFRVVDDMGSAWMWGYPVLVIYVGDGDRLRLISKGKLTNHVMPAAGLTIHPTDMTISVKTPHFHSHKATLCATARM